MSRVGRAEKPKLMVGLVVGMRVLTFVRRVA